MYFNAIQILHVIGWILLVLAIVGVAFLFFSWIE